MHMVPPGPRHNAIVPGEGGPLAERLLAALAPERWPVPPEELPAGTAVVGGAVRDALLGLLAPQPDLDLVVEGDAVALAKRLARHRGGSVVVLDAERSIARLVLHGWTLDLARRLGSRPEQDLLRRDYSANAIALTLPGDAGGPELLDPAGGLADLAGGQLRAVSEANLLEDPLRLLRGVRLAAELGLRIEPATWGWIRRHHRALGTVAAERVLSELERLAAAPAGGEGLARVLEADLLASWGGEVSAETAPQAAAAPGGGPGGTGTGTGRLKTARILAGLDPAAVAARGLDPGESAAALPLARLAVLLDPGSLRRLRASRRRQESCSRLRRWWRRLEASGGDPETLGEEERLQLQRDLEADLPALVLLAPPAWAATALARWRDPDDPLFHPRSPLDGADLQEALGLQPGPELGRLLAHLCRERAFGRLPRDPARHDPQTLTQARRWLSGGSESRHG